MIRDVRSLCATVLLALMAGMAQAASSPVFDNWVVNNGAFDGDPVTGGIQAPCAAGFQCTILTTGDGFMQVQWVDTSDNIAYIQTLVTNADATGTPGNLVYIDESFVQLGGTNGIMSRQQVTETDATPITGGTFTSQSTLNIGWAAPANPNDPTMVIEQSFTSAGAGPDGDEFSNTFVMELIGSTTDPDGSNANSRITIDQLVGLGDGATASSDVQRFYLVGTRGLFTEAGEIDLAAPLGDNAQGIDPGPVAWDDGDAVMVRWLGQRLDLLGQGQSVFGFEGVLDVTDNVEATTFSTVGTGIVPDANQATGYAPPFDWHSTFGDAPTLPAP